MRFPLRLSQLRLPNPQSQPTFHHPPARWTRLYANSPPSGFGLAPQRRRRGRVLVRRQVRGTLPVSHTQAPQPSRQVIKTILQKIVDKIIDEVVGKVAAILVGLLGVYVSGPLVQWTKRLISRWRDGSR
jgi:hypothetical protein